MASSAPSGRRRDATLIGSALVKQNPKWFASSAGWFSFPAVWEPVVSTGGLLVPSAASALRQAARVLHSVVTSSVWSISPLISRFWVAEMRQTCSVLSQCCHHCPQPVLTSKPMFQVVANSSDSNMKNNPGTNSSFAQKPILIPGLEIQLLDHLGKQW